MLSHIGVTTDRVWMDTRLGTTNNYSVAANFHKSQITIAPAKPSPALIFTSRSLATDSNSGDFFSFTLSGPLLTASHAEISSQLAVN
jgi:hypothetical protein